MKHPNLIKKMMRYQEKSSCTTKQCLIDNLFKLANRKNCLIKKNILCLLDLSNFQLNKGHIYRKGSDSLTCVGDPYSNHGIKCMPIEGLFIGK